MCCGRLMKSTELTQKYVLLRVSTLIHKKCTNEDQSWIYTLLISITKNVDTAVNTCEGEKKQLHLWVLRTSTENMFTILLCMVTYKTPCIHINCWNQFKIFLLKTKFLCLIGLTPLLVVLFYIMSKYFEDEEF